jgi:hypothetical protein
MRRILIFSVIFSVPLAVMAFSGITYAAVEFAADMVIAPKGDEPMKGKIFVKDDKVRQETSDGFGGFRSAAEVFQAKSDPNMQFGCRAQKLMHYSGLNRCQLFNKRVGLSRGSAI